MRFLLAIALGMLVGLNGPSSSLAFTEAHPSFPKVTFKVHLKDGLIVLEPLLAPALQVAQSDGPTLKDKTIVRCQTGADHFFHGQEVGGSYVTLDCGGSKFGIEKILFASEN